MKKELIIVKFMFITLWKLDNRFEVPDQYEYGDAVRLNSFIKKWRNQCQV